MSRWTPCKRREFLRRVHQLGFEGPFSGTRHELMIFQQHRLAIPSNREYSVAQLRILIREIEGILGTEVTLDSWNKLA